MRKITTGALSTLLVCATASWALEVERPQQAGKGSSQTDVTSTTMTIDANQLDMFVTNVGVFAYDKSNIRGKADGLYFPNNYPFSDKTVIYDAGMWIGGTRGGDTLVTVAEYSQEFVPGPLGSDANDAANRVYKIYKNHLTKVANGYEVRDPDNHEETIPLTAADYNEWPVSQGAPLGTDGNPWIDELGADQMTFTVFNDGDPGAHTNDAGSTAPIGIEVRHTTFAFDRSDALGSVIFMKYELFYNPSAVGASGDLENVYLSLWADPDLGGAGDDFVGCDPAIGLGYCYNATAQDKAYGGSPPATGFDFFQGPPDGEGGFMGMTSFNKYINGTDPHSYADTYNYMQGLQIDGTPLENGTTFQVPGDPVTGIGELDVDPADRRYMMSTGPFTLAPMETIEIYAAVIAVQGSTRLNSVSLLKYADSFAQSAFDADFIVPQPPAVPTVEVMNLDRKVTLTWDGAAQDDSGSYPFQGYNVYQGATAAGPWTRIATYDEVDGLLTIFMEDFDAATGEIYLQPKQFGTDAGVRRYIEITDDAFTWAGNTKLVNNHPYYFGVSAYSVQLGETPNNLESSRGVVVANPNAGSAGTRWDSVMAADTADHVAGGSDGLVLINTIDESALRDMTYDVSFYDTTMVDPDDETVTWDETWWRISDQTSDRAYGRAQSNSLDDAVHYPDFELHPLGMPEVDGMLVEVLGPPLLGNSYEWVGEGDAARWLSGVNWGGELLFGGLSLGVYFFGSTLAPADYAKVELRLTSNAAEWSEAAVYRRDQGYAFTEIGTFPGSAWDMDSDPPRQLNICFVEHDDPADPAYTADGHWNPDDFDDGSRHYLFIMDSDYNGAVDYDDTNFGPESDVQWAWWPVLRGNATTFDEMLASSPGAFTFTPNYVNTTADQFSFSTMGHTVVGGSAALDDIRVVPNPYYGYSAYETKSDVKVIKFTHLPETATIKLFNVGGDHVKTLYKEASDGTELSWNLKNEYGVYVASGVYVYYVEAPGLGDTFGKLAVMLEEERLKEY